MTSARRTVVIALLCLCSNRAVAQPVSSADTLAIADLGWRLLTLRGERRTLDAFRGRVLVVNSWATWCEPCVAELRTLASLRAAIPDSGLVFALVAAQRREPVAAFVHRRAVTLPVYLAAAPAPESYRLDAVPTTWVIDRRGRIVLRHRGAANWDTPAIRAQLQALLDESPGA